jgi:hypothetical protein
MRLVFVGFLTILCFCQHANAAESLPLRTKTTVIRVMIVFRECAAPLGKAHFAYELNAMDQYSKLQSERTSCETGASPKAKRELETLRKAVIAAGKSDAPVKEFYIAFGVAIGRLEAASTSQQADAIQESLQGKGDRMVAELEW